MSEKKAKEQRKGPKVIKQMTINCYDNGEITVTGIPDRFDEAMKILSNATVAIGNFFIQAALEGRMEAKDKAAEKPRIYRPH